MKKIILSLGFAALALGANAQVKIKDGSVTSGTTPNSNAILELESNNKGLLYPRVSLTATNAALPGRTMVAGMVVYNTNTVAGTNGVTPGFYYSNGTVWVRLIDAPATSTAWGLTGNTGTTPSTNFIGTTDNQDLVFKRNNAQAGWIDSIYNNTALGSHALSVTNATGINNTAFGANALLNDTLGSRNTAVGTSALQANTSGSYNNAFGFQALLFNTTGDRNLAIGDYALQQNTTGHDNISVGSYTTELNILGSGNTVLGSQAMQNSTTGNNNTVIGLQALYTDTAGSNNTAIGVNTLVNLNSPTSSNNTTLGYNAGATPGQTHQNFFIF